MRQHEHVGGEPVTAEVAALPDVGRARARAAPGPAAGRAARSRRRARRACRPGRPAGRRGSPTEPSQGAVEQVGVGRAHRPPQPLAAGPAVGVGPAAPGVGQPAAGTADQQQPHVLGAGPPRPAAGATAASNRDSTSASRPHGPGCSISSQRCAGDAVATGESPRRQRLHRAAAVVQPAGGAEPGHALHPAGSVGAASPRPPVAPAPASGTVAIASVTSRRARVEPVGGVQAGQVADLELAGRQQRRQRRAHLAGEGVRAPPGDQRRPGRRRRRGARSAAGGAAAAPCRRSARRRRPTGPAARPARAAPAPRSAARSRSATSAGSTRPSQSLQAGEHRGDVVPDASPGRRGRGRGAASRAAAGRRRRACARGPAPTRRRPSG